MPKIHCTLLAAWLGLAGSSLFSADWPQWRGPNRDGISKDTGLLKAWPKDGPKLLWTFESAGVGYGCPVVVGNFLYVLGAEDPEKGEREFISCVSTKDGKEVWRQKVDNSPGNYNVGWGGGPRSTPTIDGDSIYLLGARGDLQCRKTSDGSKVWAVNLVKDFGGRIPGWGYSESVLIDGDHLLCTPGGAKGTILCLNKKDGTEVWRSKDLKEGAAYSSIVIANVGVKQYITLAPGGVVGVRASDGKLLWHSAAGKNGTGVIPTAVVNGKYVFATSGYGSGCGLLELTPEGADSVKMKEIYLNKAMVNTHSGVIRVDNFIYGSKESRDQGGWVCLDYLKLDKEKEDPVWRSNKLGRGSLVYADGHFYCYSEISKPKSKDIIGVCALVEANPKEWKESGRLQCPKFSQYPRRGGRIWTHPVIANGKLFLRDHELIFCYDVRGLD